MRTRSARSWMTSRRNADSDEDWLHGSQSELELHSRRCLVVLTRLHIRTYDNLCRIENLTRFL
jgi:hypothetical protein